MQDMTVLILFIEATGFYGEKTTTAIKMTSTDWLHCQKSLRAKAKVATFENRRRFAVWMHGGRESCKTCQFSSLGPLR